MIALCVKVNGKHICTAGAEDLAVLSTILSASGNLGALTKKVRPDELPYVYLSVGGLTARVDAADEHLRWADQLPLNAGDTVEIKVLETAEVEAPTVARPQNKERQAEKERETYEYAKEVYFTFKPKFEPNK